MYDVVQGKKIPGQEKKRWTKLGVAFVQDGKVSGIKLDALPIADEKGEVWLSLFDKKPREDNHFQQSQRQIHQDLDDEIPI